MRIRRGLTHPPSWKACSPHSGFPLHACCTALGCTVPTRSDPEVLVEEEQYREKQEAMAKTRPWKCSSSSCKPPQNAPWAPALWKKLLTLAEKKPFSLLPQASFMGWYEVCLSLRSSRPLWEGCKVHLLALLRKWGLCTLHAQTSALTAADRMLMSCP